MKSDNETVLRVSSVLLNDYPRLITKEQIELVTRVGIDEQKAFLYLLREYAGLENDVFDGYFPHMVRKDNPETYLKDGYFSLDFPSKTEGKWRLGRETLAPYEVFVRDDFEVDGDKVFPQIGYFSEPYSYPAVYQNDRLWMSLAPNEINTSRSPISRAHGKVYTFGLGLGYYAFHVSNKSEVESVTIVERDREVIRLFEETLLPQFPHGEKIRIVQADAFDVLEEGFEADFVFADIWHDVGDGLDLYLDMRRYEEKYPNTEFTYWIEKTLKVYER